MCGVTSQTAPGLWEDAPQVPGINESYPQYQRCQGQKRTIWNSGHSPPSGPSKGCPETKWWGSRWRRGSTCSVSGLLRRNASGSSSLDVCTICMLSGHGSGSQGLPLPHSQELLQGPYHSSPFPSPGTHTDIFRTRKMLLCSPPHQFLRVEGHAHRARFPIALSYHLGRGVPD